MTAIPLAASQIRSAASMMAMAFHDDPFFTFTLPDEQRREHILPWLYERLLRYGNHYGRVFTTSSLAGAALWLGPQHPFLTFWGTMRTGLCLLALKLTRQELRRSLRLSNFADRMHKLAVTGEHYYLYGLGVDPSRQGKWIGRSLLQPVLDIANRQRLPCYLDTNNEKNLPFYERNDFEVVIKGKADPGGPSIWGMLRKS